MRRRLPLPGTIIDEDYSLMLLENTDIDLATAILLDKVQKGKGGQISDTALKMLRKKKLVEGRKPHLYVSKMEPSLLQYHKAKQE